MDIMEISNARKQLAGACTHLYQANDMRGKVMYILADMMVIYIDSIIAEEKEKINEM